jgi:hypothetical protein
MVRSALWGGLAALAVATAAGAYWGWHTAPQVPSVLVVDSRRIVEAKLASMMAERNAPVSGEDSERFAAQLNAVLARYAERGYTVLNSAAVVSAPPGRDITELVAQRLQVDLGARLELLPAK